MKENGLGTPATRAEILETLLTRGYAERTGKAFSATEKGIRLIDLVPDSVKSPALTGTLGGRARPPAEGRRAPRDLHEGNRGVRDGGRRRRVPATRRGRQPREPRTGRSTAAPTAMVPGVKPCITPVIHGFTPGTESGHAGNGGRGLRGRRAAGGGAGDGGARPGPARTDRPPRVPVPPERLGELLKGVFGHDAFRPYQEAVCRAVVEGRDALLVMPTGAGKSLCYQLPGLARGGTTLVVSPLIALMEDQVAKLQALGLAAERIHSGRDRAASRAGLPRLPRRQARLPLHRPRAALGARLSRRCSPSGPRRSSPSTRRTASRTGGTTSGPTTGSSARGSRCCAPRRSSR